MSEQISGLIARKGGLGFDDLARDRPGVSLAGLGAVTLPGLDLALALVAFFLANAIRPHGLSVVSREILGCWYGAASLFGLLINGQYRFAEARAPLWHGVTLARGVLLAHGAVWVGVGFWALGRIAPGWAVMQASLALALILSGRLLTAVWWRHDPGAAPGAAAVLVSATPCPAETLDRLRALTGRRLAYGFTSTTLGPAAGRVGPRLRLVPDIAALEGLIRAKRVDEVVFYAARDDAQAQARHDMLLSQLSEQPILLRMAVDTLGQAGSQAGGGLMEGAGLRLVTALERPLPGGAAALKRAVDVLVASVALVVMAPVMAVIALMLRRSGPVLFRQRRVGAQGALFDVLKFRTMIGDGAPIGVGTTRAVRQTQIDDRRVTRLGRWLRRSSLDELPQLFNVLRGDMALVGPRPHAPGTEAGDFTFEQATLLYRARHRVKPGMTGLAQVRGLRGPTRTRADLVARVAADLDYIARWSPWLDIVILLRTLPAVLSGRNAC